MQNRSFRIDDILGEDLSKETAKPKQKEEVQMTAVRRPILLPRIQPLVWGQCINNCCSSPPNCVNVREPRPCYPPWYYNRNPHAFQGKYAQHYSESTLKHCGLIVRLLNVRCVDDKCGSRPYLCIVLRCLLRRETLIYSTCLPLPRGINGYLQPLRETLVVTLAGKCCGQLLRWTSALSKESSYASCWFISDILLNRSKAPAL